MGILRLPAHKYLTSACVSTMVEVESTDNLFHSPAISIATCKIMKLNSSISTIESYTLDIMYEAYL